MTTKRLLACGTNYAGTDLVLAGCENDVLDVVGALVLRGFTVARTLVGPEFTASAFLTHLAEELARMERGDTLVVTASCHGTSLPNRDLPDEEVTGKDQALVCDDYASGSGLVRDDTLARYFRDAWSQRGRVVLVADCCYSGSMTRGRMTPTRPPVVTRYMPPTDIPLAAQARSRETADELGLHVLSEAGLRRSGTVARAASTAGVLLLAACRDDEVAYDAYFGARPNGAFTRALVDALEQDKPRTYAGWYAATRRRLGPEVTPRTPQSPQIHGGGWRRYAPAVP